MVSVIEVRICNWSRREQWAEGGVRSKGGGSNRRVGGGITGCGASGLQCDQVQADAGGGASGFHCTVDKCLRNFGREIRTKVSVRRNSA